MALVALGYPLPLWKPYGKMAATTAAITAANDKFAIIFHAPKTGTIDRVRFKTATVTTGATIDVRLETVTTTTGAPTGSLATAGANAAQVIANADDNTWFEVTLGTPYAATQGELLAIVLVNPAASFGSMQFARANGDSLAFGYTSLFTGTWAKSNNLAFAGVRYNDATYPHVSSMVLEALTHSAFSSATVIGSGGDERGNKITMPFACRVCGFWWSVGANNAALDFVLYDSTSGVLLTKAHDTNTGSTAAGEGLGLFSSTVDLKAGQVVRLAKKPGATSISGSTITAPTAGLGQSFPGGTNVVYTFRADAGGWSDTSDKIEASGLVISHIDSGARAMSPLIANGAALGRAANI